MNRGKKDYRLKNNSLDLLDFENLANLRICGQPEQTTDNYLK